MSHGMISGLLTGALIILFLGIWVWAWSKHNKAAFAEMAELPLEENTATEKQENAA